MMKVLDTFQCDNVADNRHLHSVIWQHLVRIIYCLLIKYYWVYQWTWVPAAIFIICLIKIKVVFLYQYRILPNFPRWLHFTVDWNANKSEILHYILLLATSINFTWWRHQRKHFPRYLPFVRGIHRPPVNSPHKGSDAELWCFIWSVPG